MCVLYTFLSSFPADRENVATGYAAKAVEHHRCPIRGRAGNSS
jgi:hypothetical protein